MIAAAVEGHFFGNLNWMHALRLDGRRADAH